MASWGAIVGPVANRIGGATAEIDGTRHRFEANQAGRNTLHGGAGNIHKRLWDIVAADATSVTLSIELADGLGGFPGNRRITAAYRLTEAPALELVITAATDAPTLMNPAFHGYWNLGTGPDWGGHRLRVAADRVLENDADNLPTGRVLEVAGTGFDFREAREIRPGQTIRLDNNFCLAAARRPLTPVAWLEAPDGALTLEVATTEPGLQIFDGAPVGSGDHPGHRGVPYGGCAGLAFEPQFWPDAPNRPAFPSILMRPGDDWRQVSTFTLRTPGR
jgi:aldose 1-epimerase